MFPAAGSGFRVIVLGENTFSPRHDTPKTPGQPVDRGLSLRSGAAADDAAHPFLLPHTETC